MRALLLCLIGVVFGLMAWPPAYAADPGGELLSPKRIGITASAPRYNKTTGQWDAYVTLKNRTRGKTKQNFYGPFTLVVTPVNRSDVAITNSSGQTTAGQPYLIVPVPSDVLTPGQKIKKIPLYFSAAIKKRFKAKYQLYGFTAPQPTQTNTAPVAKASISTPTPIAIGQTVQLDSTGSSDLDGNPITYTWKLKTPTGSNTTLSDTKIASPTFTPDRGGTYTAELTVNDGLVDSQPVTVTANVSSVSVMITSPPGQATITGDTVTIQGLVVGMSDNVGVTISGAHHPAVVLDNTFVAVDVPLQPGLNTITVTATDAVTGQTATTSLELTSTGPAPVTVEAEPETGLAPLPVSFQVTWQADWVPTQITADFDGNGTLDYTSSDLSVAPQYTYNAAGIYQAVFTLTDAQGATQQLKVPVVIQDEAILDQKFQALWGELLGNLSVANADGAANYFLPGSRDKYHAAFVALGSKLPSIISSFSSLHKSTITNSYGEYLIIRNINGKDHAFFVYFRQGSDGTWGLESM
jgi:hypothetical protein